MHHGAYRGTAPPSPEIWEVVARHRVHDGIWSLAFLELFANWEFMDRFLPPGLLCVLSRNYKGY